MVVAAGAVVAGVALVAAATVHTLGASGSPTPSPLSAASAASDPPSSAPRSTTARRGVVVTGRKRVTAHAGTVTVLTTLWLDGSGSVAVRVPRHTGLRGLSQLRVERVSGPQMHPFSGPVALRSGTVLRLRGSYRWDGCPRRGPQVWPQPFALPASVRVHWHRIDVPRHSRQAVCQ